MVTALSIVLHQLIKQTAIL